jgi:hypothetical protein
LALKQLLKALRSVAASSSLAILPFELFQLIVLEWDLLAVGLDLDSGGFQGFQGVEVDLRDADGERFKLFRGGWVVRFENDQEAVFK